MNNLAIYLLYFSNECLFPLTEKKLKVFSFLMVNTGRESTSILF